MSIGRQFFQHDLFCFRFLFFCERNFDSIFRRLACFQCFDGGIRCHHEVCIRRDETVFFEVKAIDFFFTSARRPFVALMMRNTMLIAMNT